MIEPQLTLQQVRVFVAVVERGTMTRAADELHLSQPAISAHVAQLERLVGGRLFNRQGRRATLTPMGATLYRHAGNVLAAMDILLQQVERMRSGELDQLTIGGNPTSCAYVLPEILARFHRHHPETRLSLVASQSPELIEQVRRDAVDVAVLSVEEAPRDLPAEILGLDELVVIESPEHPISPMGTMMLAELANAPFIRPTVGNERLTIDLDRLLVEQHMAPRHYVMDLTTWEGVKEAVRSGVGLAVAPRAVVQRELIRGELRTVTIPGYREVRTIQLLQSPRWRLQQGHAAYLELLARLRAELPVALGLQPA